MYVCLVNKCKRGMPWHGDKSSAGCSAVLVECSVAVPVEKSDRIWHIVITAVITGDQSSIIWRWHCGEWLRHKGWGKKT